MSNIKKFIETYYGTALQVEKKYKIPALFSIAQSGLETAWGTKVKGNNMFNIKPGSSWKGDKVLFTTTEYHTNDNVNYPLIINIEKLSNGKYKYTVKDYFRAYNSTYDSFIDYGKFLSSNKRYEKAFNYSDPVLFAREIANAGYATSSNYFQAIQYNINTVKKKSMPKPDLVI